ncbi:hypothetical protein BDV40DRAFT_257320 [Aspergillus tamarii]|uniref:Uncharacterized protein n=1 Tax=Aspergillus tamarii TaxID=41984 RepID=A0A5N6V4Q6_ASPTM|nr:hypothetical protein BDV40DRAFT_257320 [Aspergillus tamarii]
MLFVHDRHSQWLGSRRSRYSLEPLRDNYRTEPPAPDHWSYGRAFNQKRLHREHALILVGTLQGLLSVTTPLCRVMSCQK